MILEALDRILGLQTKAVEPVRLPIPDPREATFVIDGKVQTYGLSDPPRDHKVGTLDDLIGMATRFATEVLPPAVFYDAERVVLVIDEDGFRIERATLDLRVSDLFAVVQALHRPAIADATKFSHPDFVKLLRVKLLGALSPFDLLERVEEVRFDSGIVTRATDKKNRASWGSDIEEAVSTPVELPDSVTLQVSVYQTPGATDIVPVRCQVETLPAEKAFQLIPYPDEVERARQLAVAGIGKRLREALSGPDGKPGPVFVYQGKP